MAKKGALSLALDEGTSTDGADYTSTMKSLLGTLNDPEQDSKDSLTAWGAGLSSPGGQSGALSRAMTSELAQRNQNKALKAQYVPLVMDALTKQQQARQQATMLEGFNSGAMKFAGMPPEELARLEGVTGMKLREIWEKANFGEKRGPGDFSVMPGGGTQAFPDAQGNQFFQNPDGSWGSKMVPGVAEAQAYGASLKKYGEGVAGAQFEETPVLGPNRQPGTMSKAQRLGLPSGPPQPPGSAPGLGPAVAPGPAAASGAATAGQAAPGGVLAPPVRAPAQPVGAQPAGDGFTTNAAGRPMQANQGARDADAVMALREEMQKALQERARLSSAPATAENVAALRRTEQDVAGLSREIQQMQRLNPGMSKAAAPSVPAVAATGAPPGFMPTQSAPADVAADKALDATNADWISKTFRPVQDQGTKATDKTNTIQTMRTALGSLGENGTGYGGEAKKKFAEVLGAFGVKDAERVASDYQIAQSALLDTVNKTLNEAAGPQTDQDAVRAQQTFVSLKNTKRANEFLMDYAQAVAELQVKKASFYRDMQPHRRKEGDLTAVDRDWSEIAQQSGNSVWDSSIMRRWKKK